MKIQVSQPQFSFYQQVFIDDSGLLSETHSPRVSYSNAYHTVIDTLFAHLLPCTAMCSVHYKEKTYHIIIDYFIISLII